MSQQVPTLDIRRYDTDRNAFVAELGAAYREFGFCGISGHGIAQDLIDKAYDAFVRFFALPAETLELASAEPRPRALPRGPIEEYADRAWIVSLGGFAVSFLTTRSVQRAIAALSAKPFSTRLREARSRSGATAEAPAPSTRPKRASQP